MEDIEGVKVDILEASRNDDDTENSKVNEESLNDSNTSKKKRKMRTK
jgi:hypothetical protein